MNILWSHTTQNTGNATRVWGVYHNDIVHYLSLNALQQPLEYEIIKHPNTLKTGVTWVDIHANIQWVPTEFFHTPIPGFSQPLWRKIDSQISLAFQPSSTENGILKINSAQLHIAEGLFSLAKAYARHQEFVSVLWYHDHTAIVFAFNNGELVFSNRFKSSNTQEHLYYALLPFHEEKLTPEQLGVYVLCDEIKHPTTAPLFEKFIPQAKILTPQLPWVCSSPAPLLHIVTPLIKMASCASPVET